MYVNPNSAHKVRDQRIKYAVTMGYRQFNPASSRNSETPKDLYDSYAGVCPAYPAVWGKYLKARRSGLPAWLALCEAQGDGLMRVLASHQRQSRADFKVGKGVFPLPVYVAKFKSGKTSRVSFWSRHGKPIDFAAGYNISMLLGRAVPVAAHVEHNGEVLADSYFEPVPLIKAVRKETPAKRLAAICRALNEGEIDAALAMARAA